MGARLGRGWLCALGAEHVGGAYKKREEEEGRGARGERGGRRGRRRKEERERMEEREEGGGRGHSHGICSPGMPTLHARLVI